MNNTFDFLLLNTDFNQTVKNMKNPKILILAGIGTIISGSLCIYQLLSKGPFYISGIFLIVLGILFLNSYSAYDKQVAINTPTVKNITFKVDDERLVAEYSYYISADKKGPRTQTTIFKFSNIESMTYVEAQNMLTIVGKYKSIISFDNPNREDVTNDFEKFTHTLTTQYKIKLNNDYKMFDLIKEKSGKAVTIF